MQSHLKMPFVKLVYTGADIVLWFQKKTLTILQTYCPHLVSFFTSLSEPFVSRLNCL